MLHALLAESAVPSSENIGFAVVAGPPALTWGAGGSLAPVPPVAPPPVAPPPPIPPLSRSATHSTSFDSGCRWHQRAVSAGEGGSRHSPTTSVSSISRTVSGCQHTGDDCKSFAS